MKKLLIRAEALLFGMDNMIYSMGGDQHPLFEQLMKDIKEALD